MDLEDLFERQREREERSHELGVQRFQKAIKEAEERMYSSHHLGGRMCITANLNELIKFVSPQFYKASPRVKPDGSRVAPPASAHGAAMYHCTVDLAAAQSVYIALMTMMDAAGLTKRITLDPKEHTRMEWSAVERLVGERLEKEAMLRRLKSRFPFVYNLLKTESFLKNSGTNQKIYRLKRGFDKRAKRIESMVERQQDFFNPSTGETTPFTEELGEKKLAIAKDMATAAWSKADRQSVGAWFVSMICRRDSPCAGWFVNVKAKDGKNTVSLNV